MRRTRGPLNRPDSSNRSKVMPDLLVDFLALRFVYRDYVLFIGPSLSKSTITFKRFELEPRIKDRCKALVETHLSGKFQPNRSSLKFFGFHEKKT